MTVHIDISNRQKMGYLVELLKSLDFVEGVRVDEETQPEIAAPATANNSLPADDKPSFVERHNGSLAHLFERQRTELVETTPGMLSAKYWGAWKQNPLSIEKIDYEIRKMRDEWDRDIY